MKTDRRIGGGASALHYRHPLLAAISLFLRPLADWVDPARRRVRWTPLAAGTAAVWRALAQGTLGGRFREARRCLAANPWTMLIQW